MMRKHRLFLLCLLLLNTRMLLAQCPDGKQLWKRIVYLRDSLRPSEDQQLAELMAILPKANDCPFKRDSSYVLLLQRIGALNFLKKDLASAIQYTKQSIAVIRANVNNPAISQAHLVKSYYNLSYYYGILKMDRLRFEAIDSCIINSIRMHEGYVFSVPLIKGKMENLIYNGDYYRCLTYGQISEKPAIEFGYNLDQRLSFSIWQINALILLKRFDEARSLTSLKLNEADKEKLVSANVANLYALYGTIEKEFGNISTAEMYFGKALKLYQQVKDTVSYTAALNNVGYMYGKDLKMYKLARQYYNKALATTGTALSLNVYANIAELYVQQGLFDSAFIYFQKAFDRIKPGINEMDLLQRPAEYVNDNITEYISNLVLNKADAYVASFKASGNKDHLVTALNNYRIIDHLFEKLKTFQLDLESKLFWRNHIHRLYENAVQACWLMHNPVEAFYFFEKSRAVLLEDQLNEQRVLKNEDVVQQVQLMRTLNSLEQQVAFNAENGKVKDSLQAEIFKARHELDQLKNNIKERNQFYYQSVIDTSFVTIESARGKFLSNHDALIEVLYGDSAIYVLSILKNKIDLQKLDKKEYDTLSNAFVSYLSNSDMMNREFGKFVKVASGLYGLLFSNLDIPAGRIVISPDGKYFPFEALITNADVNRPQYFIEDHAVSYTYSARFLINAFDQNKNNSAQNFMGMAPVQFAAAWNLPTLAGSDASLDRVESHFSSSNSWTSEKATRGNFLQNFYRYRIIQLYTHATAGGSHEQPVIYFADSALNLSDLLYENKPFTDLVVLSACETGTGKLYEGEGVFGFNRGFAAIGIPSTIANLWQVENASTYKLTELFYQYLSQGMPVDVALQNAKKEFIKTSPREKQLPYYWAASILTGKTEPIQLKKSFLWIYILAGTGLLFLFIVARARGITRIEMRK